METIVNFLTQWAYAPATLAIATIIAAQKKYGFLDPGKFRWILAPVYGLVFAFAQFFLAIPLGYEPIQIELPKVVVMGIATGLMAVLGHTLYKNTKQGVKQNPYPPKL